VHNDQQLWPASGWANILPDFSKTTQFRLENIAVAKDDSVRFVLKRSGHTAQDTVIWNPTVIVSRRS
jgi:hypothetical protein